MVPLITPVNNPTIGESGFSKRADNLKFGCSNAKMLYTINTQPKIAPSITGWPKLKNISPITTPGTVVTKSNQNRFQYQTKISGINHHDNIANK